jgi:hypothetical protein
MRPRSIFLFAAGCLFCFAAVPLLSQTRVCPLLEENVVDAKFKLGQIWTYQNRPGETGSTLTILRIDSSEKVGGIVHVRVDGLNAHNPHGDRVPSVGHMPFSRDAILISVVRLFNLTNLSQLSKVSITGKLAAVASIQSQFAMP